MGASDGNGASAFAINAIHLVKFFRSLVGFADCCIDFGKERNEKYIFEAETRLLACEIFTAENNRRYTI